MSLSISGDPEAAGGRCCGHALKGRLSPGHQVTECPDSNGLWCTESAYHRFWLWYLLDGRVLQSPLWYEICFLFLTHIILWKNDFDHVSTKLSLNLFLFVFLFLQVLQHFSLLSGWIISHTGPVPPLFGSWVLFSIRCWRESLLAPGASFKTTFRSVVHCPQVGRPESFVEDSVFQTYFW